MLNIPKINRIPDFKRSFSRLQFLCKNKRRGSHNIRAPGRSYNLSTGMIFSPKFLKPKKHMKMRVARGSIKKQRIMI